LEQPPQHLEGRGRSAEGVQVGWQCYSNNTQQQFYKTGDNIPLQLLSHHLPHQLPLQLPRQLPHQLPHQLQQGFFVSAASLAAYVHSQSLRRYYKPETRGLDFEGLMEDIKVGLVLVIFGVILSFWMLLVLWLEL
jgi:hypothetical protein